MKFLGVDPGQERIGLSISDDQAFLARPLKIIKHISRAEDASRIAHTAAEEGCGVIVVGVPFDSNGGIGPRARASLKLVEAIRQDTELSVLTWDESGTSQSADNLLVQVHSSRKKRQKPKDDLAAAIILTDFLENRSSVNQLDNKE